MVTYDYNYFTDELPYVIYERSVAKPIIEQIHMHDFHEIFMLLEGNMDYYVEGTKFPLEIGDIVVIGGGQPHRKLLAAKEPYKCFVAFFYHDFFKNADYAQYEQIFTRRFYTEHKISASAAKASGFYDSYLRLADYTKDFSKTNTPIARLALAESLYHLNNSSFSDKYVSNDHVIQILDYIDNNFTRKISLDGIAKRLFLSKYYICKIFKKHTGISINAYITSKRLKYTNYLISKNKNITTACIEAGFSDYSSFYKAQRSHSALLNTNTGDI